MGWGGREFIGGSNNTKVSIREIASGINDHKYVVLVSLSVQTFFFLHSHNVAAEAPSLSLSPL